MTPRISTVDRILAGLPPLSARQRRQLAVKLDPAVKPKSAKREREVAEFLSFAARNIRRAGERVADADPEDLASLLALQSVLDHAVSVAAAGVHERHSWTEISRAVGTTRQSAYQRWGRGKG